MRRSGVLGLRALGQDLSGAPGSTASLADWGIAHRPLVQSGSRQADPPGAQGTVVGASRDA